MNVTELVIAQDWAALRKHFEANAPATAHEFHARGVLGLSQGADRIDWRVVLGDMQKACELAPEDPIFRANFAQALLDSGQAEQAYRQAVQAVRQAPQAYAPLEKLASAAFALHRWDEARDAALRAALVLQGKKTLPETAGRLLMQLQARWWVPLASAGLSLRRPEASDAAFVHRVFDDPDFLKRFHRFQRSGPQAAARFVEIAQQSPYQSRRLDWIVRDRSGQPVGQAGLVDIDWPNRRAELLVGFPGQPPDRVALQASVAVIDFAFNALNLAKLVSYVYADNPAAQSNTVHLGFRNEGLLRSHVAWGEGRIDLHVNGMLAEDYRADARLQKLAARWKGSPPA